MPFDSGIGCLTGSEVTVSPIDLYNTHKGERIMKEEIKNPRAMTVKFRLEVANALRDLCSKTGISLTRAVNNAVEAYMPVIQKLADAVKEPRVTSENPANLSTNVDFDELYDSLFQDCFEITHDRNDFLSSGELKSIIENAIEENDIYRNSGIRYDSRFIEFLAWRYRLVVTQSRKHSRKRGYVGIRPIQPISHEEEVCEQ